MKINITYKNKLLSSTLLPIQITHYDVTIDVDTTSEYIYGMLKLNKQHTKVIQFNRFKVQNSIITRGRLTLTDEDIKDLDTPSLQICDCSAISTYYSNSLEVNIDTQLINTLIKIDTNNELIKLKAEVSELKDTLERLTNRQTFSIPNCDFSYSKPGMIPVTIDSHGTFILKRPFANTVEKVNGQISEGGEVIITTEHIKHPLTQKSISEILVAQQTANNAILKYIETLQTALACLQQRVIDLELRLETHLSNPII